MPELYAYVRPNAPVSPPPAPEPTDPTQIKDKTLSAGYDTIWKEAQELGLVSANDAKPKNHYEWTQLANKVYNKLGDGSQAQKDFVDKLFEQGKSLGLNWGLTAVAAKYGGADPTTGLDQKHLDARALVVAEDEKYRPKATAAPGQPPAAGVQPTGVPEGKTAPEPEFNAMPGAGVW